MRVVHWMERHRWGLFLGLALLAFAAVILRGLVQAYLAVPAAQFLWWLRLRTLSIPQSAIWIVFLFLAYMLFAASLVRPVKSQPWQWQEAALGAERPLKRLVRWIERGSSSYARYRLCQTVAEQSVAVLAERLDRSPHQVKTEILQGHLTLPEDVFSYLREGLNRKHRVMAADLSPLTDSVSGASALQVDPRLLATLEFLESEQTYANK